jgi:hypothetical protein
MPGAADALSLASPIAGAALGVAQAGFGFIEEKKAANELKRLKVPFKKIQDEYFQNKNLAEELAGSGLPDATKAFMTTESERGLGTGIRGILESGGSPSDISKLFDVFDTSVNRTAAEDATARIGNIKNMFDVNKDLAGQKDIQFGVNELQPYESALKSITDRRNAGIQNIFGGAQTAIGSVGAIGTSLQNKDLLSALLKGNNSPEEDMYNKLFSGAGETGGNAGRAAAGVATAADAAGKTYAGVSAAVQALLAAQKGGTDVTSLLDSIDWSAIMKR